MDAQCRIELLGGLRAQQGERILTRFRAHRYGALLGLPDIETPERLFQVEYLERDRRVFPPLNAEAGHATTLPLQLTRFFGREAEIDRLRTLLQPGAGVARPASRVWRPAVEMCDAEPAANAPPLLSPDAGRETRDARPRPPAW